MNNIDNYIQTFPQETQNILKKIRNIILEVIPYAKETISYGIPTFNINGKHIVFLSGWKHHISLYPIPKGDEDLLGRLKPYIHGKGTLQFPLDEAIPYDIIKKVVAQLAKWAHT